MPTSNQIALLFDCDGTISEDTTTRLLEEVGINPKQFWRRARRMEANGWDPPLAYMKLLTDFAKKRKPITRQTLREVGKKIQFSPGIPSFFEQIRRRVKRRYANRVGLSIHIVSSGFEAILRASKIAAHVDDIFGCRFGYDGSDGVISFPRASVSFTEKTKFIYAINKGLTSENLYKDPYCVNNLMNDPDRPVPLRHMIYIGDGPTDVPCMSLLKNAGCEVFAVYTEPRYGIPKSTYELARQGRSTRGPYTRDYRHGSDLRRALDTEIEGYAENIIGEVRAHQRAAVRH